MQGDGNLVVYKGHTAIWSTGTNGHGGAEAVMQGDGNLVVYWHGHPVWASHTDHHGGANLHMQNDGNLVIYWHGKAIWNIRSASQRPHDDYPAALRRARKDSVMRWGFPNRECTSFVAWRLHDRNHVPFNDYFRGPRWGNADEWDDAARALHIPVNGRPAVGAVAQTDRGVAGHVAWVVAVGSNGRAVRIEQYNHGWAGRYSSEVRPTSAFRYIHIKDLG